MIGVTVPSKAVERSGPHDFPRVGLDALVVCMAVMNWLLRPRLSWLEFILICCLSILVRQWLGIP